MKAWKRTTIKCMLTIGILFALSGCATTKRDWHDANRQGTIEAYDRFLQKHPDAKQAHLARQRLLQLHAANEWSKAEYINTIDGYKEFLDKYPRSKQAKRAKLLLEKLQATKNWKIAKSIGTIASYKKFLNEHPNSDFIFEARNELEQLISDRDWKFTVAANTRHAFEKFAKRHHTSRHFPTAMRRIVAEDFDKAKNAGTDQALIDFIKKYDTTPEAKKAIKKLKNYEAVESGQIIQWRSLPNVYAGGARMGNDTYPCGINMRAFSIRPRDRYQGRIVIVGSKRFYKPYAAMLSFSQWSTFDGHMAKGSAIVTKTGLKFQGHSIVLRKKR